MTKRIAFTFAFLLLGLFSSNTFASISIVSRHVALVIGNDDYKEHMKLRNAVNDADAVADLLEQQLCFEKVIRANNADRRAMLGAIGEFAEELNPGDIALVYYAGIGASLAGQDMLLPADFPMDMLRAAEGAQYGVRLSDLVSRLRERSVAASILLVDTNFQNHTPSLTRGIEPFRIVDEERGVLILHATLPGAVALDNHDGGDHGPFATALLQNLGRTDLGVLDRFNAVTLSVHELTNGKQTPYLRFHLLPPIALKGNNCSAGKQAPSPGGKSPPAG